MAEQGSLATPVELAERLLGVPEPPVFGKAERGVGARQVVVEAECVPGCAPRQRIGLSGRHVRVFAKHIVDAGQSGVGLGVIRVLLDGLIVFRDRSIEALRRSASPVVGRGQKVSLSLKRRRPRLTRWFGRDQIEDDAGEYAQDREGQDGRSASGRTDGSVGWRLGDRRGGFGSDALHLGRREILWADRQLSSSPVKAKIRTPGISREPVNWQAAFTLPAFDGSLILSKETGDLFPGLEALFGVEFRAHAPACPFPPRLTTALIEAADLVSATRASAVRA